MKTKEIYVAEAAGATQEQKMRFAREHMKTIANRYNGMPIRASATGNGFPGASGTHNGHTWTAKVSFGNASNGETFARHEYTVDGEKIDPSDQWNVHSNFHNALNKEVKPGSSAKKKVVKEANDNPVGTVGNRENDDDDDALSNKEKCVTEASRADEIPQYLHSLGQELGKDFHYYKSARVQGKDGSNDHAFYVDSLRDSDKQRIKQDYPEATFGVAQSTNAPEQKHSVIIMPGSKGKVNEVSLTRVGAQNFKHGDRVKLTGYDMGFVVPHNSTGTVTNMHDGFHNGVHPDPAKKMTNVKWDHNGKEEAVFTNVLDKHDDSKVTEADDAKPSFKTIPNGTAVRWPYRGAIGHGTVIGVHKLGTSNDTTEYSIREKDHHPGEADVLYHYGAVLTKE